MTDKSQETLAELINLILNPGTRAWERKLLVAAKQDLEAGVRLNTRLAQLEYELRPLAVRNNLTPDLADFYRQLTGKAQVPVVKQEPLFKLGTYERAIFAGGCFWCMVEPFETQAGVISVLSGYTGGHVSHPTYEQVSSGSTGHVEAVEIIFDPKQLSYQTLLDRYWQLTDPTDANGQINDRGSQYRPVIFVTNARQRERAQASKAKLAASTQYQRPIVTGIETASTFWPAENYHQQFYRKQPQRYKHVKRERQQFLYFQKWHNRLRRFFKRD